MPCPQGAFCPGGYRLWALPGYYAGDDLPPVIACHPAEACLGGRGSLCATGYHGIGCSACADGYYRDNVVYCTKCQSQGAIAVLFLVQVLCLNRPSTHESLIFTTHSDTVLFHHCVLDSRFDVITECFGICDICHQLLTVC